MSDKTLKFIEDCTKKHGNTYDYSKVTYSKCDSPIIILCRKHGEFKQAANAHRRGQGCPKCGIEKVALLKYKNTNIFVEKAKTIHSNLYDYSKVKYIKAVKKVIITCLLHGDFEQTPNAHLNGQGCPTCGKLKASNSRKKTLNSFLLESKKIHKEKYDYTNVVYVTDRTPVNIVCPTHGMFSQTPNAHLVGKGCSKCAHAETKKKKFKGRQYYIDLANKKHKNKYDYSETFFETSRDVVSITCPFHGKFIQRIGAHVRSKVGCKKCAIDQGVGFTKKRFVDKYTTANFYLVCMKNENESFIKIGITGKNYLTRLRRHEKIYQIIPFMVFNANSSTVWAVEKFLKKELKQYKYTPIEAIDGKTECFHLKAMMFIPELLIKWKSKKAF